MTEADEILATDDWFWIKICPDGVNGEPVEARVLARVERWGILRLDIKVGRLGPSVVELIRPVNWFGRLRWRLGWV